MKILFRDEFLKIASRRIVWTGLLLLVLFLGFRIWAVQADYRSTIGGITYSGREAIQKDKELAKQYAGPLTEEKIKDIYERFGFISYDPDSGEFKGNYCSRFVTERFTNYLQTGGNLEEIEFYQGEDWERNAAPLLSGRVDFGYVYGWEDLRESWMIVILCMSILFIVAFSPLFSEEYTLKTADLLLTTEHGKGKGILIKLLAAAAFFTVVCIGIMTFTAVLYLWVFGPEGTEASSQLLQVSAVGYLPETVGAFYLCEAGLSFAGLLLLMTMTAGISACSRNPFLAVIISLAVFLVPVLWIKVFAPMYLLGEFTKTVNHFMVSMPVMLPMNLQFAFTGNQISGHVAAAAAGVFLCSAGSCWKYRNYQGGK